MSGLMNYMVRRYIKKWDQELDQIKTNCWKVQQQQLRAIGQSPLVYYLNNLEKKFEDYESFHEFAPLSKYSDIKKKVFELRDKRPLPCKYFAQSSGTTSGEKKLIPTTDSFVRCNHLRGSWYILNTLYRHNPKMSVFKAQNLLVGGSLYSKNKHHTIGDVSGIMLNRIPYFFRPWYVPSIKTAVDANWEHKIEETVRSASRTKGITLLGGTPTWVLTVCRMILEQTAEAKLTDLWPDLQAYIHGGVSFTPYEDQFKKIIPDPSFRYIEVYNASEGFFAFQDEPDNPGMLLMCGSGVFFEFIRKTDFYKSEFNFLNISQVKKDEEYVIIISTISGLLRYVQGDIISFTNTSPYRIKVIGRISEYVNAFGEDLSQQHVESALSLLQSEMNFSIRDYSIAPSYINISTKGFHEWYIEFFNRPENILTFQQSLDRLICKVNSNYLQKRQGNLALDSLRVIALPTGTVDVYFKEYGTQGGQSKLPKLNDNRKVAERLNQIIQKQAYFNGSRR